VHNHPIGVNINDINDDLIDVGGQYMEETCAEHMIHTFYENLQSMDKDINGKWKEEQMSTYYVNI